MRTLSIFLLATAFFLAACDDNESSTKGLDGLFVDRIDSTDPDKKIGPVKKVWISYVDVIASNEWFPLIQVPDQTKPIKFAIQNAGRDQVCVAHKPGPGQDPAPLHKCDTERVYPGNWWPGKGSYYESRSHSIWVKSVQAERGARVYIHCYSNCPNIK